MPTVHNATGHPVDLFAETDSIEILLDGPAAVRRQMVPWPATDRPNRDGIGAKPQIEVYFRLASSPDLGVFKFQTGSWSLASDLVHSKTDEELNAIDGPTRAILKLTPVEFTAKNGPRAGQLVSYVKPELVLTP